MPTHAITSIELAVIALARNDPVSSLVRQNGVSRYLFGVRAPPLADSRLEALRRYAILRRTHRGAFVEAERIRLRDAGYDDRRIAEIDRLVAPNDPERPESNPFGPAPVMSPEPQAASIMMRYLPKTRTQLFASITLLAIALWPAAANAQADPIAKIEEPEADQDGDHFILGVGGAYMPAYQGADSYRFQPLPDIDVAWEPLFLNLRDGLGVKVIDTDVVTAGVSLTGVQGYRRRDAPEGIGKLSLGLGGRAFVSLKAAGFVATLGGTKVITGGTKGFIADVGVAYPVAVSSRFTLVPSIGTTWADRKHNDRYFGVNAEQSLASGLPQFRAGSGFTDATAALSANYRLTDRISLSVTGAVTTLLGDVKDSPIVYHKTRPLGFVSFTYRL
ncbi:MipA/OmpV family protein [Sphingomonas sp. DT-204]|uniref:MipA/OmpV family protein n=1 Tax=Sphingomonas sp. DT-204 TaxID=3396166 RepID=UPI003F1D1001